jgi:alpha-tubulin suppressor-like RCC1 family protein
MRRIGLAWLAAIALLLGAGAASSAVAATNAAPTGRPTIAAGGLDTCAVLADGTAKCWGDNSRGQLGNGTLTRSAEPVTVENSAGTGPLTGISQIFVGGTEACAVMRDRTVQCWGDSSEGGLGAGSPGLENCPPDSGNPSCSTRPVTVENAAGSGPLTGVARLAIGGGQVCAALTKGTAQCWGDNSVGELGIGNNFGPNTCDTGRYFACSWLPIALQNSAGTGPLTGVVGFTAGVSDTCARLANGTVACWGDNELAQLGTGSATGPQICDLGGPLVACSKLPVVVKNHANTGPLTGVVQVVTSTYSSRTCARLNNRTVQCWGRTRATAVKNTAGTAALQNVLAIAGGSGHWCALLTNGTIKCWGDNRAGQLGDGTKTSRARPVAVRGIAHVVAIAAGSDHSCAVSTDGTVRCWGQNLNGQLGNGTTTGSTTPVIVQGLSAGSSA